MQEQQEQNERETCPKCASERWMTSIDAPIDFWVHVTPSTWTEKSRGNTNFKCNICADCGFTEFYAVNPAQVWFEWSRQNR